jgi:cytochrome c-type biogenesis protein CcmH/NrfF
MIPLVVVPTGPAGEAYAKAASTILCDCGCPAQSVKECACSRAEEMRSAIAADAASGKSGDAIIASYVARYGQKILISPEASGFNLVAWVAPGVGLVVAAVVLAFVVRRWNRRLPAARPGGEDRPAAEDGEYYARLAKDLEDLR